MSECPECDKALAVKDKSQSIGEFLEWLSSKGIMLAHYPEDAHHDNLMPIYTSTEKLLAEFFGIDLNKMEQEKTKLLEQIRLGHTVKPKEVRNG